MLCIRKRDVFDAVLNNDICVPLSDICARHHFIGRARVDGWLRTVRNTGWAAGFAPGANLGRFIIGAPGGQLLTW